MWTHKWDGIAFNWQNQTGKYFIGLAPVHNKWKVLCSLFLTLQFKKKSLERFFCIDNFFACHHLSFCNFFVIFTIFAILFSLPILRKKSTILVDVQCMGVRRGRYRGPLPPVLFWNNSVLFGVMRQIVSFCPLFAHILVLKGLNTFSVSQG